MLLTQRVSIPSPVDGVAYVGTGLVVTLGVGLGFGFGKRSAKKKKECSVRLNLVCQSTINTVLLTYKAINVIIFY